MPDLAELMAYNMPKSAPNNKVAGLVDALLQSFSQKLDDQKWQRKVGRLLGVEDERERALSEGKMWMSELGLRADYNDTLNHILLGGLTTPEGFEPRKALANALINVRETGLSNVPLIGKFVEGPSVEDRIDINNNDFGTALARKMMEEGTYTQDAFIERAKQYIEGMETGRNLEAVDGLKPQLSTSGRTPNPSRPRFRQPVKMPFLGHSK
jgi:hypothetical protein|tara:strand:+ start:4783 stop:5415 length:633 start_codon:yes stop_codon:yes gene_type:complete